MTTHRREDEVIALDAKCPNTPDMFESVPSLGALLDGAWCKRCLADKCITDDFPKQIDQREVPDE